MHDSLSSSRRINRLHLGQPTSNVDRKKIGARGERRPPSSAATASAVRTIARTHENNDKVGWQPSCPSCGSFLVRCHRLGRRIGSVSMKSTPAEEDHTHKLPRLLRKFLLPQFPRRPVASPEPPPRQTEATRGRSGGCGLGAGFSCGRAPYLVTFHASCATVSRRCGTPRLRRLMQLPHCCRCRSRRKSRRLFTTVCSCEQLPPNAAATCRCCPQPSRTPDVVATCHCRQSLAHSSPRPCQPSVPNS